MNRYFLSCAFALILALTSGCGESATKQVEDNADTTVCSDILDAEPDTLELFEPEVLPKAADELFNDFFYNYASDLSFQRLRTAYTIKQTDGDSTIAISKSDWDDNLLVEDCYAIIYEREEELTLLKDTSITTVTVERINLQENTIDMFLFDKLKGEWIMTGFSSEQLDETPNADFLDFYRAFTSDSTVHIASIHSPLKFIMQSEEEDIEDEVQELTPEEWMAVSADLPFPAPTMVNIDYGQTSISKNHKRLLVEGISNGLFIKYRFMKTDGRWMLIEVAV